MLSSLLATYGIPAGFLLALQLLIVMLLCLPAHLRLRRAWAAQLALEASPRPSIPMPSSLPVECIYCGPPKGGPAIRTICSDCRPRNW